MRVLSIKFGVRLSGGSCVSVLMSLNTAPPVGPPSDLAARIPQELWDTMFPFQRDGVLYVVCLLLLLSLYSVVMVTIVDVVGVHV